MLYDLCDLLPLKSASIECSEEDLRWAASDYRTSDVGSRSASEHNLNGAVVLWENGSSIDDAIVIYNDGNEIVTGSFNSNYPQYFLQHCCVGQENFWVDKEYGNLSEGIIGNGKLRILAVLNGARPSIARVFRKAASGTSMSAASSQIVMPSNFVIEGVTWGNFWRPTPTIGLHRGWADNYYLQSGFVLYDNMGDYYVIYESEQGFSEIWNLAGPFSGLFGSHSNPLQVFAIRRDTGVFDGCCSGDDYFCAVFSGESRDEMILTWVKGCGADNPNSGFTSSFVQEGALVGIGNEPELFFVPVAFDFDYFPTLAAGGDFNSMPYSEYYVSEEFSGGSQDEFIFRTEPTWTNHYRITPEYAYRSGYTRRVKTSVGGVATLNGGRNQVLYDCGFVDAQDQNALDWISIAFGWDFEYGVLNWQYPDPLPWPPEPYPQQPDCFIGITQSYGRSAAEDQPTCYPDSFTMAYLIASPVVHGARGIGFWGGDHSLASSWDATGPQQDGRYPMEMLRMNRSADWNSVDMTGRVFGAIESFTGNQDNGPQGPDFLGALVSDQWVVMDSDEAIHADYSNESPYYQEGMNDSLCFIALENVSTNDILLIVVNDDQYAVAEENGEAGSIYFPGYFKTNYDIEVWHSHWSLQCLINISDVIQEAAVIEPSDHTSREIVSSINNPVSFISERPVETGPMRDIITLNVYLNEMYPHTAALIRFRRKSIS